MPEEMLQERRGLADLLGEITTTSDADVRRDLMDEFLRRSEPSNRSIAAALCRDFRADRNTWLDDFMQIVQMAAMTLLEEMAESADAADEVRSFQALLRFRARSAAVRFVDSSSGFNALSGQSSLKRRRRELERTRAALYAQGLDPSDAQIVEETNRRMLATRSDAARQGMLSTVEDLQVAEVSERIEDHAHPVASDVVETDSELHSVERQALIDACIEACEAESPHLGEVARLWFAPATDAEIDSYDGHPTATSLAAKIGVEASTARAKVSRVRQIAQHVARERFHFRTDSAPPA